MIKLAFRGEKLIVILLTDGYLGEACDSSTDESVGDGE